MGYLIETMKSNLFPKRAVIPVKSPSKEDEPESIAIVDSD
jgi:hypothetical protein